MLFHIKLKVLAIILIGSFTNGYTQERLFENDSDVFLHTNTARNVKIIEDDSLRSQLQVPQDLAGLVSQPQKMISISPKVNDPLPYPYPSTKIAAAYYDDFSNSAGQWLERARDSVVENKEVAFGRKNYLQLNTIDSGINLSRASGIDFSKNFEYEIWLVQLPEQKKKLSICLGLDSLTHDHGLTVYIDEKGKFTLYTPDPNSKSKKWRGNTAWLPKKYRSSQMKVTIRHIDGRYDIFVNDRYLKSLKNPPFFRGDGIHVANYQAHSSVIFNAIRIVYL